MGRYRMKITDTHLFFYKTKECFSNFYKAQFVYMDKTFPTSEHAFMWAKAKYFDAHDYADKILETPDPMDAKYLGRLVPNYKEDVWDTVREEFMFQACLAKFSQNEGCKSCLLGTGDRILVEASPTDKIWGIGLDENNPEIYITERWQGRNLLGIVLMRVRDELRKVIV
jgi:ribA/ribD-fused uncharacterized protein